MSGKSNVVSLTPIPSSGTDPGAAVPKDRRASRRAATQAEIVSAAWDLVRTQGLAGLSMRDLGDRVGMRAQSVYGYFA
ncbi:MAG: TetR/AcrR family transcriptional regulator, partial [Actinomycetes bacterium]